MADGARRMILGFRPGPLGEGAQDAAEAGADFVYLPAARPDAAVGADALSVAACLMSLTQDIGLAAEISTAWQPFNVARALASFDLLSRGRCGWSPRPLDGESADAPRFREHLEVVFKLFDSWDDDALVFDKANAVFADRAKVRRIRHAGAYFTVDGPLNAPRPPQGHPVLIQPLGDATAATDVALAPFGVERPASAAGLVVMEADGADAPERLKAAFAAGACDGFLVGGEIDAALSLLGVMGEGRAVADGGDFRARLGLARPGIRYGAAA